MQLLVARTDIDDGRECLIGSASVVKWAAFRRPSDSALAMLINVFYDGGKRNMRMFFQSELLRISAHTHFSFLRNRTKESTMQTTRNALQMLCSKNRILGHEIAHSIFSPKQRLRLRDFLLGFNRIASAFSDFSSPAWVLKPGYVSPCT